ncbi:MAG: GspH/FimT family pseudopilin [Ferrimonas sp.]
MHQQRGLTLIECTIALAILMIVLGVSQPAMKDLFAKGRTSAYVDRLYADIQHARQLAIVYMNSVTICPLDETQRCNWQWQQGYSVFIDADPKGEFDQADELIVVRPGPDPRDQLSANRNQIRFSTDGFTGNSGSLRYCPERYDSPLRQQLTISATGGVRYHINPATC